MVWASPCIALWQPLSIIAEHFLGRTFSVSGLDGALSTGFYSVILIVRYMAPSAVRCMASKLGTDYRWIHLLVGFSVALIAPTL